MSYERKEKEDKGEELCMEVARARGRGGMDREMEGNKY